MNNKWNQWRQQELKGKTDDAQLHAIISYLQHTHKIPRNRIKMDWYLLLDRYDYTCIGVVEHVLNRHINLKPIVRHPDIMVLDKYGAVDYIIELDGAVHHYSQPAAKKTAKRNSDYKYAEIPCIIIDILDLQEIGQSWFDYLDDQLLFVRDKYRETRTES